MQNRDKCHHQKFSLRVDLVNLITIDRKSMNYWDAKKKTKQKPDYPQILKYGFIYLFIQEALLLDVQIWKVKI